MSAPLGPTNPGIPKSTWRATAERHRVALAVFCLFLLAVGVYYVGIKGDLRSAINRWRPIVLAFWDGDDIYRVHAFPTPPIMVLILTPFCLLGGHGAMAGWFAVKAGLTVAVLVALWKLLEERRPLANVVIVAALALAVRPIMGDLLHGNVNLWILFTVTLSLALFRQGRDGPAGLVLALAIACKLTPLLFVPYFAWKRAWTMVLATLAGLVVWLWLIPGWVIGFARNQTLLVHWAEAMVWPYLRDGEVDTSVANQSAAALFHRSLETLIGPESLASWGSADLGIGWTVIVLGLMGGLAYVTRHRWTDRTNPAWLHEWGIVMLVMLLVSERSWKHHFVWLLPISLVLLASAAECWQSPNRRTRAGMVYGLFALATVLIMSTSQDLVKPLAGVEGAKWMQSAGSYVWAALCLLAAHLILLTQGSEHPARASRLATGNLTWFPRAAILLLGLSLPAHLRAEDSSSPTPDKPPTIETVLEVLDWTRQHDQALFDYQGRIVEERAGGGGQVEILDYSFKIRRQPFSAYLHFHRPDEGSEFLFVEGAYGNRVLAPPPPRNSADYQASRTSRHDAEVAADLEITRSWIIARDFTQRIDDTIRHWEYRRANTKPAVTMVPVRLNHQACLEITVSDPSPDVGLFAAHSERLLIDRKTMLPIRWVKFGYPNQPGSEPGKMIESITFLHLRLNPGFSDEDFSIAHPEGLISSGNRRSADLRIP